MYILLTYVVGYFAYAQYDVLFYCLCERSEAISREGGGLRSICPALYSNGLPRHFVPRNDNDYGDGSVGYFACAQYDESLFLCAQMTVI